MLVIFVQIIEYDATVIKVNYDLLGSGYSAGIKDEGGF